MSSKPTWRQRWLISVAIGMLGIYALLGFLRARDAERRLRDTRAELDEVVAKIQDIERLQDAPTVAALQLESPAEITNRVAAARQAAGISQASLLREEPLDPQRIQRSDFEMRSTTIQLSAVTLPQVLTFCDQLRDEQTGSVVRDLSLTVPTDRGSGGDRETWETGLTLTQMIFSPKSR